MFPGIRLSKVGTEWEWLPLPDQDDPASEAEKLFNAACRAVTSEWAHRVALDDRERTQWLQHVAYQIVTHLLERGIFYLVDERLRGFDRYSRGNKKDDNPFQSALVSIFAHESPHDGPNDTSRWKMGRRLRYAYRHYVPAEFLTGFFHQIADKELIADPGIAINADFVNWVASMRLHDERPETRGKYPKEIDDFIARYRRMQPIMAQASARAEKRKAIKREQQTGCGSE